VVDTDYGDWEQEVPLPDGSGSERQWREDRIVEDTATVEPSLRAGATAEIDTCKPLDEVVAELEAIAGVQ
jgi:hypothetical protein